MSSLTHEDCPSKKRGATAGNSSLPKSDVNHGTIHSHSGGDCNGKGPLDLSVGGTCNGQGPLDLSVGGTCNFTVYNPGKFGQELKNENEKGDPAVDPGVQHVNVDANTTTGSDTKVYTTKSPFEAKPRNRKEAQASNYWPQYFDAETEEMVNHEENGTWSLVPATSVPKGAKILRTKWVYDDKKGMDGKIIRFKARLTAMGNFQREGVDYFETYASVMRTKTLRVLLQVLNSSPDHDMEHWDIKAAFINAKLEEDIWICQPDGHQQRGAENMVCKLNKALYGLKQAGRAWQKLLTALVSEAGFSQLLKDEGVFVAHTTDGGWCIIGTHVDDLFPVYNKKGHELRDRVFDTLARRLKVKNEGPVKWALKILIERDREGGVLKISQGQFVREILQRFGFTEESDETTPAYDQGPNSVMGEQDMPEGSEEIARLHALYPVYEALGCLWWLANISRADIYLPVFQASQYASKPSKKLWLWISKIFRYLSANPDRGLVYLRPVFDDITKFAPREVPLLQGDVDASFADSPGKRSTLGQLYWFLGGVIDWKSKRSTRVLDSSTDAECASLVVFGKENAWLRDVLKELGIFAVNAPTLVREDNTAAIALSGQGPTKRSRHFDIAFYKFKQQVEYKEMILQYVKTSENPADFFTKPLPRAKFVIFRDMIMGGDLLQAHFKTVHITHLQMSERKKIPEVRALEPMVKMMVDEEPDYMAPLTEVEKQQFQKLEVEFLRLPRKPSILRTVLQIGVFNKQELIALGGQKANETKGRKVYYPVQNLRKNHETGGIYERLDNVGEQALWWINSKGIPYVRMKHRDVVVVTFVKGSEEYKTFKKMLEQTLNQKAHLDKPAWPKGMPPKAPTVLTLFVTLTATRAMTQFHFELGMKEILGDGTETVNGDRNKWIAWRLQMAHRFAFKIQAEKDQKAFQDGEWEISKNGEAVAFDPEVVWHSGRQTLEGSCDPEIFVCYQVVLAPTVLYHNSKLNINGGFGQHEWTQKTVNAQMKELNKNCVDMEKIMGCVHGEEFSLQALSSILQTSFKIPHGVLVQSDPRWWDTATVAYWDYSDADREQWCLSMSDKVFAKWQKMVHPLLMPEGTRKRKPVVAGAGVELVCKYILTNPGEIFAMSREKSGWHHPNCYSMDKDYGGKLHFKDLMGAGNFMIMDYRQMWKELAEAPCCGKLWGASIIYYADRERRVPPTLRLMTIDGSSKIYERILELMVLEERDNHAQAYATFEIRKMLEPKDVWNRYEHTLRMMTIEKRLYRGNVFQPQLFSLLADHLGLLGKRQMYEAQPQKELFGSYGEDEEKGGL